MTVGTRIRELRVVKHCWSREALSIILGCNIRAIQNWEEGSSLPSLKHFVKLLSAFNISYDEFMKGVVIDT